MKCKGQKLNNFQKKEKKNWQKKAGADLKKKKKDLLGQELGEKMSFRDKKRPIFKKKRKKGTFWVKEKQAGAELKNKKRTFFAKIVV